MTVKNFKGNLLMKSYMFDDLKILTHTELDPSVQWNAIACSGNGVNLAFADTKILHIKGTGIWTHSIVVWQGIYTDEFALFKGALSTNAVVYKNKEAVVLYLRNNKNYGCLQVSCRLHKSGNIVFQNNIGNPTLKLLDELYVMYMCGKSINACMNQLMGNAHSLDLTGVSYDATSLRRRVYTFFTKPFLDDPGEACKFYEEQMALALDVRRKTVIRRIFVVLFEYALSLRELDVKLQGEGCV